MGKVWETSSPLHRVQAGKHHSVKLLLFKLKEFTVKTRSFNILPNIVRQTHKSNEYAKMLCSKDNGEKQRKMDVSQKKNLEFWHV